MPRNHLAPFGDSATRLNAAIATFRNGGGVVVVDDEDRENEGDLIFPASVTVPQMAMLIHECSGIVCLPMSRDMAKRLDLPPMTNWNTSRHGTAFTVSIEAAHGVTTGVSAADRVRTVQAATAPDARPEDLARPGHVFPLVAKDGGVLERRGHTEAVVDLARLAGLAPCGVLCELTNTDGSMKRLPQLAAFCLEHGMPLVTVADIADRLAGMRTAQT